VWTVAGQDGSLLPLVAATRLDASGATLPERPPDDPRGLVREMGYARSFRQREKMESKLSSFP
jgi:hypothetical protein